MPCHLTRLPCGHRNIVMLRFVSHLFGGFFILCTTVCCSTIVKSGRAAVVTNASGETAILGEGEHLTTPFAQIHLYDLRSQERTEEFVAITADGAPIRTRSSLVTFYPRDNALQTLDREIGRDYYSVVVAPYVQSAVRKTLASFRWDQLDSDGIIKAQSEITAIARINLLKLNVVLESVELRSVFPDLPNFNSNVVDTGVWEQKVLTARAEIKRAIARADALRAKARGIADANNLISPTLSVGMLSEAKIKAWTQLVTAPTSSVSVIEPNTSARLEIIP